MSLLTDGIGCAIRGNGDILPLENFHLRLFFDLRLFCALHSQSDWDTRPQQRVQSYVRDQECTRCGQKPHQFMCALLVCLPLFYLPLFVLLLREIVL